MEPTSPLRRSLASRLGCHRSLGSLTLSIFDQLDQLSLDQVITEARGVALCTKQEAMPFIQDAKMLWPAHH